MVALADADEDSSGAIEVWPVILEKAFAQYRQTIYPNQLPFDALAGGEAAAAYRAITGRAARFHAIRDFAGGSRASQITAMMQHNGPKMISIKTSVLGLNADHVYVIESITQSQIRLIDPLAPGRLPQTYDVGDWFSNNLKGITLCE